MSFLTVTDPRHDGQVIYVHPRQGFCVELSIPPDSDWSVECFSEYFVLTKTCIEKGVKKYWFTQLFDLKAWARVSNVQIAEVYLQFKGKAPDYDQERFKNKTIYVVLQAEHADQRDTITLINPVCTRVRVAPHQLLEVVLYDTNSHEITYQAMIDQIIKMGGPHLEMEEIAHKVENARFVDVNNDKALINRHPFNLPVNPKIEERSPIYPKRTPPKSGVYRAVHFLFQIARHCVGDVQRLPNGAYEACGLTFYRICGRKPLLSEGKFGRKENETATKPL
jgi:hypothetical protein